ncbi:hypothetical protein J0H58_32800 [bacterium]|nr:hypothetical protein [bacterium]
MRLRDLRLLVAAAVLCPAVGCNWMREWREQMPIGRRLPTGKLEPEPAEKFVKFINGRAEQLQSVEYGDVRMRVSGKGLPVPVNLDGNLAAAQPRSFRMTAQGRMAGSIDLGSNPEQFWVYTGGGGDTMYVYAAHSDFETGKAQLPGNLPFEPDWVMQALGMNRIPAAANYEVPAGDRSAAKYDVRIDDREQAYVLGWTARAPNGVVVRKEIVFDGAPATGKKSQVKRHVLRDAKNQPIATADIRAAEVLSYGQNDRGESLVIQYPTHLTLKWENPRFEMDLYLTKATVNGGLATDPARRAALFTRPTFPNTQAIDLARFDLPTGRPR